MLTQRLQVIGPIKEQDPLFLFREKNRFTKLRTDHVRGALKLCCQELGLEYGTDIVPHSFRSGLANDMSTRLHTDAKVKAAGRWKSNCFERYHKWNVRDIAHISRLRAKRARKSSRNKNKIKN